MEFKSNKPIFRQIADYCINAVITGDWPAGGRVPSARELASQLAVNLHTVLKAYEMLEADGIIYSRRGMGFFVADEGVERAVGAHRREIFDSGSLDDLFEQLSVAGVSPAELTAAYERYLGEKQQR